MDVQELVTGGNNFSQNAAAFAPAEAVVPAVETVVEVKSAGDEPKREQAGQNEQKPVLEMPSQETLKKSADEINKLIKAAGRQLDMRVHEKTGRLLIKVVDSDTGEVVREVPPEKTLDFLASVLEHAGILVNKSA